MNMRWLNFPFQPNTNIETTLGHQHWINVTLSTLFRRCFVNVETTSINVRRLNFHFQPNINVETTLINVDDQRCFNFDLRLMCLLKDSNGKQKQFVDFFVIPELYIIISSTQFGTNEIVISRI